MVILWARAEGKSGWAQEGGREFARNGIQKYKSLNCLTHFENFFFSLGKQKRVFFFHFEEFLETEEDRTIQYCSRVLNMKKILQSSDRQRT